MSEQDKQPRRTDRASLIDSDDSALLDELAGLRKPLAGDVPVSEIITPMVRKGELYEALQDGKVHCTACAHNCMIRPGARGICQVRYNASGDLYVPWGYVAALQSDPTEKKPFYHIHPGSDTLTFGMLGCDMHCSYCFTGDTVVITERGPMRLDKLFEMADTVKHLPDGDAAYVTDLQAVAQSGTLQDVNAVYRHHYEGPLAVISPYYLPALRCTADHRVYATEDPDNAPEPIAAQALTNAHYLAIPRGYHFSSEQIIDVGKTLARHQITYKVPWKLSKEKRAYIAQATADGMTSREIGEKIGKDPSYVRHIRSKLAREAATDTRTHGAIIKNGRVRFPNEHRPGIPATIELNENMARLLGYYCAEGSITTQKDRPNSHTLYFTFSLDEVEYAREVQQLLEQCLGVTSQLVERSTTLAVQAAKASAVLLFKTLAGGSSGEKQVPQPLYDAHRPVVEAFVDAFIAGDGHRYENGKVTFTSVSERLAQGVAWLALKMGYPPSLYQTELPAKGIIEGREVNQAPYQYTVVWYEDLSVERQMITTDQYYLIPIREMTLQPYSGNVYNMEVDVEHNYLAGYFLVKNCQNWDISQTLRDANAGRPPREVTPEGMVEMARRNGSTCVASSYNEPLITSEWSRAIFEKAQAAGFTTMYISNGNATREVLEYIRPVTDGYKIDLKTMQDKNYRKLGAVLEHILEGIRMVHELGFWLEIVTLIVPGFNSAEDELRDAAQFIKDLSPDIPWHVTAFHKDYKMRDPDNTEASQLIRAAEIGYEEGLNYVYAGNAPTRVGPYEHTYCPDCKTKLIDRVGYVVRAYNLTDEGTCPKCGTIIPGIWPDSADKVRTGTMSDLFFRVPKRPR